MKNPVPDNRFAAAPPLPERRPPTRAEVWERFHSIYFDYKAHAKKPLCTDRCNNRSAGELEGFCKEAWVWYYVSAFNFDGWRRQPDWTEGDTIIPGAVPDAQFQGGDVSGWNRVVYACLETANQLGRRAA